MAFCPACGRPVADGARFCSSCGSALPGPPAAPAPPSPIVGAPPPAAPGYPLPGGAPYYGPVPGEKTPILALILSFLLTGLGQLYNQEIAKGVVFLIVGILLWVLTVITFFLCVAAIPFWIYGMYDAYTRAQSYNYTLRATGRPPW